MCRLCTAESHIFGLKLVCVSFVYILAERVSIFHGLRTLEKKYKARQKKGHLQKQVSLCMI